MEAPPVPRAAALPSNANTLRTALYLSLLDVNNDAADFFVKVNAVLDVKEDSFHEAQQFRPGWVPPSVALFLSEE